MASLLGWDGCVPETFDREAQSMALRFKNKGYPDHVITKALLAACSTPRANLLKNSNKRSHTKSFTTPFDNIPVFSTPFSLEF